MATSAVQRARQVAAAKKVKSGEVKFPLVCGHCGSKTVTDKDLRSEFRRQRDDPDPEVDGKPVLYCVSCGRRTVKAEALAKKQQEIRKFVEAGVDVPLGNRKVTDQ